MVKGEPYFGSRHLPEPKQEVVIWVDLMGTANLMEWSYKSICSNIGKLHLLTKQSNAATNLRLYPMMDGIYIIGSRENKETELADILYNSFEIISRILVHRHQDKVSSHYKFSPIIRAGLAEGEVYHGSDIEETEIVDLSYVDSLVMGKPITRAHLAERSAPPFGIMLDDSVDSEHSGSLLKWWDDDWGEKLSTALIDYFELHASNPNCPYPQSKKDEHISEVEDHF